MMNTKPDEKVLRIGIVPYEAFKERTLEMARGNYKPAAEEPKVYFDSLNSLAQILSEDNRKLLRIILESKPSSIKELGTLTGRSSASLSRTLKNMEVHSIVSLHKAGKELTPVVNATRFEIIIYLE